MFDISNEGIITLTRGDSFETPLFINQGTEIAPARYELTADDIVYFAVMQPNQRFEDAIVKKVYDINSPHNDEGDLLISFEPLDTEYLLSGTYYYMVKLRTHIGEGTGANDYRVQTVIPQREFRITGESQAFNISPYRPNTGGDAQADWEETNANSPSFIKNKPTIPSKVSQLSNDSGYLNIDTLPTWDGDDQ